MNRYLVEFYQTAVIYFHAHKWVLYAILGIFIAVIVAFLIADYNDPEDKK